MWQKAHWLHKEYIDTRDQMDMHPFTHVAVFLDSFLLNHLLPPLSFANPPFLLSPLALNLLRIVVQVDGMKPATRYVPKTYGDTNMWGAKHAPKGDSDW